MPAGPQMKLTFSDAELAYIRATAKRDDTPMTYVVRQCVRDAMVAKPFKPVAASKPKKFSQMTDAEKHQHNKAAFEDEKYPLPATHGASYEVQILRW